MNAQRYLLIGAALVFLTPPLFADESDSLTPPFDQDVESRDSINHEMGDTWDIARDAISPQIGIAVREESGRTSEGVRLAGIGVLGVVAKSPAEVAGIRGPHTMMRTAAVIIALYAGGMFFPPAMIGAMILEESGIAESHDLIVAVDGCRTKNLVQFQRLIDRAEPGQIVYLSIVRGGERHQFQVRIPGDPRGIRGWY